MKHHIIMANDRYACGVDKPQFPFPSSIGEWIDPADLCRNCAKRQPGLAAKALEKNEQIRLEWERRVDAAHKYLREHGELPTGG